MALPVLFLSTWVSSNGSVQADPKSRASVFPPSAFSFLPSRKLAAGHFVHLRHPRPQCRSCLCLLTEGLSWMHMISSLCSVQPVRQPLNRQPRQGCNINKKRYSPNVAICFAGLLMSQYSFSFQRTIGDNSTVVRRRDWKRQYEPRLGWAGAMSCEWTSHVVTLYISLLTWNYAIKTCNPISVGHLQVKCKSCGQSPVLAMVPIVQTTASLESFFCNSRSFEWLVALVLIVRGIWAIPNAECKAQKSRT